MSITEYFKGRVECLEVAVSINSNLSVTASEITLLQFVEIETAYLQFEEYCGNAPNADHGIVLVIAWMRCTFTVPVCRFRVCHAIVTFKLLVCQFFVSVRTK